MAQPASCCLHWENKNKAISNTATCSRVKDKVVIVTGQNSPILLQVRQTNWTTGANSPNGIGRASAHQFANNGAKAVYICDFADKYLETHKREMNTLYPSVDVHV